MTRPHDQHCATCDLAEFSGVTYDAAHAAFLASPSAARPEREELRERINVIADEASAYLRTLEVAAVPSWLLKLYGLTVERHKPKGPWGTRERQA